MARWSLRLKRAHQQVLAHAHVAEQPARLGHRSNAAGARSCGRREPRDRLAGEADDRPTSASPAPRMIFMVVDLPLGVAAQQADDLSATYGEAEVEMHLHRNRRRY